MHSEGALMLPAKGGEAASWCGPAATPVATPSATPSKRSMQRSATTSWVQILGEETPRTRGDVALPRVQSALQLISSSRSVTCSAVDFNDDELSEVGISPRSAPRL